MGEARPRETNAHLAQDSAAMSLGNRHPCGLWVIEEAQEHGMIKVVLSETDFARPGNKRPSPLRVWLKVQP